MHNRYKFSCLILLTLFLCCSNIQYGIGQNLHFSLPHLLVSDASTDKAVDITQFKGGYFLTWKDPGKTGRIRLTYLGRIYDTVSHHPQESLADEQSAFAPVYRVWKDRLYLFWIDPSGTIKYILNRSDTDFVKEKIYTLALSHPARANLGITAAALGDQLVIATHGSDRHQMMYAVVKPGPNRELPQTELKTLPGKTSGDYPFVVALKEDIAQFAWESEGSQPIARGNYNITTNQWIASTPIAHSFSGAAPAVYHLWNTNNLFYIWKGAAKDKRMRYSVHSVGDSTSRETLLPEYFNTNHPVSICNVDGNNFLVAFVRENGHIYLSRFANYNAASWMEDILLKDKGNYTLKDIVIPGSHDAGMSVLTATGGSQSGTINECNTLTQAKTIELQLLAGLRMFDLRVGSYNHFLYTKHCPSDCMSDAIGGGYGEKLDTILDAIAHFLAVHRQEIILLTFSHFCEREASMQEVANHIVKHLGAERLYSAKSGDIQHSRLSDLAGKVIVTFEGYARADKTIDSCTIAEKSDAFINFRRAYAATHDVDKLLAAEELFFRSLKGKIAGNDLVRLDWQLSQSPDEAAMVCNDFQNEKTNPLLDAGMLLTNIIAKHKSILDLSLAGNKYLPSKCNEWIDQQIITPDNKPNILYVDAAGDWITDYCVFLNQSALYQKKQEMVR